MYKTRLSKTLPTLVKIYLAPQLMHHDSKQSLRKMCLPVVLKASSKLQLNTAYILQ